MLASARPFYVPAVLLVAGMMLTGRVGAQTPGEPAPSATPTFTPAPPPACGATPEPCRTPAQPGRGLLLLNDRSPDDKDSLLWKWSKGALTTKAEFGDPRNATSYLLCLYDGKPSLSLIAQVTIPAGGACAGKPCWTEKTRGFRYVDRERTPDGIAKLVLSEGLTDGKAQIQMSGKGTDLPMPAILGPTIALLPPVTVVLKNSAGVCWKARYSAPAITNAAGPPARFKDRAD